MSSIVPWMLTQHIYQKRRKHLQDYTVLHSKDNDNRNNLRVNLKPHTAISD
jgi:hypothetical protein